MKINKILALILTVTLLSCGGGDDDPVIIVGGPTGGDMDNGENNGGGSSTSYLQDHTSFHIGNIVSASKLSSTSSDNQKFREILGNEFNSITAENDMKMGEIYRGEGNFNFDKGDAIVAYAKANSFRVHGHTLVWHQSIPGWLNNFSGTDAEFEELIKDYVKTTVSHFAEEKDSNGNSIVASWDVMNEYFDGGSIRNSIFRQKMGDDYIKKIFQWAREANSNVKLFYNDYNIAGEPNKRAQIINMVNDFVNNNVPIDGLGMQMHLNHNWPTNDLPTSIQDIADTGLLVHVSELDVKVNYGNDITELTTARAQAQSNQYQNAAYYYQSIVPTSQQFGITIWGARDRDSWLYSGGTEWPLLFDNNFDPKPAYDGFTEGLKGNAVN